MGRDLLSDHVPSLATPSRISSPTSPTRKINTRKLDRVRRRFCARKINCAWVRTGRASKSLGYEAAHLIDTTDFPRASHSRQRTIHVPAEQHIDLLV